MTTTYAVGDVVRVIATDEPGLFIIVNTRNTLSGSVFDLLSLDNGSTRTCLGTDMKKCDHASSVDVCGLSSKEEAVSKKPTPAPVVSRFKKSTAEDIKELQMAAKSKKTNAMTRWGIRIYRDWLMENDLSLNFEDLTEEELGSQLKVFYAEVRQRSGVRYSRQSMLSMRAAIYRHLTMPPHNKKFSILRDPSFTSANSVFIGSLKKMKQDGVDKCKHYPAISSEDLKKMYVSGILSTQTPISLQRKVFFELMLHFGRRGKEELREIKREHVKFCRDEFGREYAMLDMKNGRGAVVRDEGHAQIMYGTGLANCPLKSLKLYVSRLNVQCREFFQKSKINNWEGTGVWYRNSHIGINTLARMMSEISTAARLSKTYTNHSIRATCVMTLRKGGFAPSDIMAVTGHRSVSAINAYFHESSTQVRALMSDKLASTSSPRLALAEAAEAAEAVGATDGQIEGSRTAATQEETDRSTSTISSQILVKQFKEKIANSIDITADTQRLIYQGRVLNDNKKLSEYDVNGKTIHVVQRPPPSQRGRSTGASAASSAPEAPPGGGRGGPSGLTPDGNTFVMGSFSLPVDPGHVQTVIQQVISGMGDLGPGAHVISHSSNDGSSMDVRIHLGQVVPPQLQSESQLRVDQARRMLVQAQSTLDRLENPSLADETAGSASPMQTAATTPPTSSSESAATSGSPNAPTAPPAGESGNIAGDRPGTGHRAQSPQHPSLPIMAELLTDVAAFNTRLQPHMELVQQLMANDAVMEDEERTRSAQRSFNLVSEALHYVSHIYHSLSDLMVDMHRPVPRHLWAAPSIAGHHVHIGPMQPQVNVQANVAGVPPRSSATTSSSHSSSSSSSSSSSNPTTTTITATPNTATASANLTTGGLDHGGAVHITSTSLPGGGTASVASTNPYMFMELGSHAFTINSISAHVSTEDGVVLPPPSTATPGSNPNTSSTTTTTSSTHTMPTPSAVPRPESAGLTPESAGPTPAANGVPPMRAGHPPQTFQVHFPMGPGGFPGMPGGAGGFGPGLAGFAPAGFVPPGAAGMMPPEVIQNILQMVTQQAFTRPPAPAAGTGATSTSTSSTSASASFTTPPTSTDTATATSTTTTTTTAASSTAPNPSSTTAGPGQPRAGAAPQPGAPPGGARPGPGLFAGMGGLNPLVVDPLLPCDSLHFMMERAQLHANNQNLGEGMLGGMMANLVSSLTNQQNVHTTTAQQRPRTTGASTGTTPSQPGAGQAFNPFANLFGGAVLRPPTPAPATAAAPTAAPAAAPTAAPDTGFQQHPASQAAGQGQGQDQGQTASGQQPAEGEFTDEVFTQLVRGISNYVAQAALGRPTDTIANFLRSLGQNYTITPSEGVLMDVFNVVANSLTFTHIMAVFYGQPAPLQTLQAPLHDMVADRILNGATPTDANITEAVDRLMNDIAPEIEQACEDAHGRDDIDFRATLHEFTRHNLQAAIRFIMDSSVTDDQFGQHLYTLCQNVIHEFIVLGVHCLEGREQALQRLIEHQMRHVSRGVNPAIQQWMVSIPVREMTRMLDEITIPSSEIEQYVRRTGDMETSPQPSEGSFMSAEESAERDFSDPMADDAAAPSTANASTAQAEAMDIDSPMADSDRSQPVAAARIPSLETVLAAEPRKLPPPPTPDVCDEVSVVIGSEAWHHEVPQEWVPVIARDVRRQSRDAVQPPFSDAYLHGMPAKRRKIGEKKAERELSDLSNIVPETVRRAVAAAGVEPLGPLEDLVTETSVSLPLHAAFQQQVCESVHDRIAADPDFSAEKFPNASKFFNGGK